MHPTRTVKQQTLNKQKTPTIIRAWADCWNSLRRRCTHLGQAPAVAVAAGPHRLRPYRLLRKSCQKCPTSPLAGKRNGRWNIHRKQKKKSYARTFVYILYGSTTTSYDRNKYKILSSSEDFSIFSNKSTCWNKKRRGKWKYRPIKKRACKYIYINFVNEYDTLVHNSYVAENTKFEPRPKKLSKMSDKCTYVANKANGNIYMYMVVLQLQLQLLLCLPVTTPFC